MLEMISGNRCSLQAFGQNIDLRVTPPSDIYRFVADTQTMSRSIGEIPPVQEFLPDWMAVIIALVTQLGDIWFLTLLLAVLYWTQVDRQDDLVLVGGMLVAGIGFYRFLKYTFELPRPDEPLLDPELVPWVIRPLYEVTAFSGGYGFPSGHATVTTIVYFGLAMVLPVSSRRVRFIAAGSLVALVGFTRIALGLHFLVDIVVGVVLGGTVLYVGFKAADHLSSDRITILLFVAVVLNALYFVESAFDIEAAITFGAALGLFGGWQLVVLARKLVVLDRPSGAVRPLVVRGGLATLALSPLVLALEVFPIFSGEPYPVGGAAGLVIAVAVILPIARHSTHVQRFVGALTFWIRTIVDSLRRLFDRAL